MKTRDSGDQLRTGCYYKDGFRFKWLTSIFIPNGLYAGLSTEVTPNDNGAYVVPWGRIQRGTPGKDIVQAMKPEKDGGTDVAKRFSEFCEDHAQAHE